jgi:hypothetical protein
MSDYTEHLISMAGGDGDQLAAIEAPIPDDAVEAAAQTLWIVEHGPWISGGGIAAGGTPWGTSREAIHRSRYRVRARAALEAATLPLLAMVREQRAAIERVRELHKPRQFNAITDGVYFGQTEFNHNICDNDHEYWPCPTIAAITATEKP